MNTKNNINDKPKELKNNHVTENLLRIKKLKIVNKIIENKNKLINTVKNNKLRLFAGLGITAAMTLTFKTDESSVFDTRRIDVPITKNIAIVNNSAISVDDFYRKMNYEHRAWFYKEKNRYDYSKNIDKKVNHKYINNVRAGYNKNKDLTVVYEDSYLSYKIDTLKNDTTNVVCHIEEKLGGQALGKPLGFFTAGGRKIVVYNFIPDTTLSQSAQDKLHLEIKKRFDHKINAVEPHERGHDQNDQKGINLRLGLGLEKNLKLYKHDEVVANIYQFNDQRENYIKTGDEKYITGVFKFYLKQIKDNNIKPSADFMSEKEVEIIGEGIRAMWERAFTAAYKKRHLDNIKNRSKFEDISFESKDAEQRYENILNDIYTIEGPNEQILNFKPFIKDFELRDYEKNDLAEIQESKPLNEMDKLGMILDRHGEKAYNSYIREQKERVEKEDKAREEAKREQERRASTAFSQGKGQNIPQQNREAIINQERRIAQNRRQRRSSR